MLISGVAPWFPELIAWRLRLLRYAAMLPHVSAALVSIGAFIIHVYMGTAMVRGGIHIEHSRRGIAGLGQDAPPPLVQPDHRSAGDEEMIASA
jgi:hypothetical protein